VQSAPIAGSPAIGIEASGREDPDRRPRR